jgi:heme-degrading monooxygenase HmoA
MAGNVHFSVKNLVLLAASVYLLKQDVARVSLQANSSKTATLCRAYATQDSTRKEGPMFSVIFEVFPKKERLEEYLTLAKHLKPILEKIDGFVDHERFESKRRRGWILSHSTWRDEKSVVRWRTTGEHHKIQERGRSEVFQDYHLRVGDVIGDTNPPGEAPNQRAAL